MSVYSIDVSEVEEVVSHIKYPKSTIKRLISVKQISEFKKRDYIPPFFMHYRIIHEGGSSVLHSHDFLHEGFVVKGEGIITDGNYECKLRPGIAFFIPPNVPHQTKNTGKGSLEWVCTRTPGEMF